MGKRSKKPKSEQAPRTILDAALRLHGDGFWIVPCAGKRPIPKEWQRKRLTQRAIQACVEDNPDVNIGIVLGKKGLIDVECDTPEAEQALKKFFKDSGLSAKSAA